MMGCVIGYGFCYLLCGVRGSVLEDQRCCGVREVGSLARSGRQGRTTFEFAVRRDRMGECSGVGCGVKCREGSRGGGS